MLGHGISWHSTWNEMEKSGNDQDQFVCFIDFSYDMGLKRAQLQISPKQEWNYLFPSSSPKVKPKQLRAEI